MDGLLRRSRTLDASLATWTIGYAAGCGRFARSERKYYSANVGTCACSASMTATVNGTRIHVLSTRNARGMVSAVKVTGVSPSHLFSSGHGPTPVGTISPWGTREHLALGSQQRLDERSDAGWMSGGVSRRAGRPGTPTRFSRRGRRSPACRRWPVSHNAHTVPNAAARPVARIAGSPRSPL